MTIQKMLLKSSGKTGKVEKTFKSDLIDTLGDYLYDVLGANDYAGIYMLIRKEEIPIYFLCKYPEVMIKRNPDLIQPIPIEIRSSRVIEFSEPFELKKKLTKLMERLNIKAFQLLVDSYPNIFAEFWLSRDNTQYQNRLSEYEREELLDLYEDHSYYLLSAMKSLDYLGEFEFDAFVKKVDYYLDRAICHEVAINDHSDMYIEDHEHPLGKEAEYKMKTDNDPKLNVTRDLRVRIVWEFIRNALNEDLSLTDYEIYESDDLSGSTQRTEHLECPYCDQQIATLYIDPDESNMDLESECEHFIGTIKYNSELSPVNSDLTLPFEQFREMHPRYVLPNLLDGAEINYEKETFDSGSDHIFYFISDPEDYINILRNFVQNLRLDRVIDQYAGETVQNSAEDIKLFVEPSKYEVINRDPRQSTLDEYISDIPCILGGEEVIIPMEFDIFPFLKIEGDVIFAIDRHIYLLNRLKGKLWFGDDLIARYKARIEGLEMDKRRIAVQLGYMRGN